MKEYKNYQKITIFGIANFGDDCVFLILAKILFSPIICAKKKKSWFAHIKHLKQENFDDI